MLIFNLGGREKGFPHNVTEKKKETVEVNENIDDNWRHSCTPVNEVYHSRAVTNSGMYKHKVVGFYFLAVNFLEHSASPLGQMSGLLPFPQLCICALPQYLENELPVWFHSMWQGRDTD